MDFAECSHDLPHGSNEIGLPAAESRFADSAFAQPTLKCQMHTMPPVHPFLPDPHRAVRLAKRYGHKSAAQSLLMQLNAFEQAIALADTLAVGKQVVCEVWLAKLDCFSNEVTGSVNLRDAAPFNHLLYHGMIFGASLQGDFFD